MSIEVLEQRIAPAGLVLVAYDAKTGVLTLTGDAAANQFTIVKASTGKGYRVEGQTATSIGTDGTTSMDFPLLTAVTIKGGGDSDLIGLTNTALTALDIELAAGDVGLENVAVKGAFDFKATQSAGTASLTFQGSYFRVGQDASIQSAASLTASSSLPLLEIKGHLDIVGSAANDLVSLSGAKSLTIGKGVTFDGGDGEDELDLAAPGVLLGPVGKFSLGKAADGVSLAIKGGLTGNDIVAKVTASGALKMTGSVKYTAGPDLLPPGDGSGEGGNELTIDAGSVAIAGKNGAGNSVEFLGGTAVDKLLINGKTVKLAGGLLADVGAADDDVTVSGTSTVAIGKNLLGTSLQVTGEKGTDSFAVRAPGLTLAGNIVTKSGDGLPAATTDDVNVDVSGTNVKIGAVGGLSLMIEGSGGIDRAGFGGTSVSLAGGITMDGKGIDNPGSGSDVITFILGKSLKLGKATDTGNSVHFSSGGQLAVISGIGAPPANFSASGGFDLDSGSTGLSSGVGLVVAKATIGKNKAGVSVGIQSDGVGSGLSISGSTIGIAGVVDLDFSGGSGSLELTGDSGIPASRVTLGTVKVVGGNGNEVVEIKAAALKAKAVDIDLGGGDDTVTFQGDGSVTGDLKIDLGSSTVGGTQTVVVGGISTPKKVMAIGGGFTVLANTHATGSTTFTADRLSVKTDMLVSLGNAATTLIIDNLLAKGTLTVTGGTGADTLNFERAAELGRSRVSGAANIDLGLGDDTLLIGNVASMLNTGVDFLAAVTIDDLGGLNDSLSTNLLLANKFKLTPSIDSAAFEHSI